MKGVRILFRPSTAWNESIVRTSTDRPYTIRQLRTARADSCASEVIRRAAIQNWCCAADRRKNEYWHARVQRIKGAL